MTAPGCLRFMVLGLLRDGTPRHGYALMKAYRDATGLELTGGNVYRVLHALRADGFVSTVAHRPDEDPRRAPCRITEAGADAFDAWLADEDELGVDMGDDELSARLLFLHRADGALSWRLMEHWQEQLQLRERTLERARERAEACDAGRNGAVLPLPLVLARRARHVAADLEFLQELRSAYLEWTNRQTTARATPRASPTEAAVGRRR
jgi:DNA-binding PadR family transcriptional regulator